MKNISEDEKKLIDENIKNGITQDKNHIWGMEDDLGTPAKPRQGTDAKAGQSPAGK
ncbi:hypothetical protein HYD55_03930 [Mycoplasmopsis bovis]|nr:hypothetical protein [Mycoplasmopsis bovis]QQH71698.1 hypothetical protein HYD55_03930 [Mycoplasmopsis bovis]